jgi:hypothetical protein
MIENMSIIFSFWRWMTWSQRYLHYFPVQKANGLINFAQWRYSNQWSNREVLLLLVENYNQYPAQTEWNISGWGNFWRLLREQMRWWINSVAKAWPRIIEMIPVHFEKILVLWSGWSGSADSFDAPEMACRLRCRGIDLRSKSVGEGTCPVLPQRVSNLCLTTGPVPEYSPESYPTA